MLNIEALNTINVVLISHVFSHTQPLPTGPDPHNLTWGVVHYLALFTHASKLIERPITLASCTVVVEARVLEVSLSSFC